MGWLVILVMSTVNLSCKISASLQYSAVFSNLGNECDKIVFLEHWCLEKVMFLDVTRWHASRWLLVCWFTQKTKGARNTSITTCQTDKKCCMIFIVQTLSNYDSWQWSCSGYQVCISATTTCHALKSSKMISMLFMPSDPIWTCPLPTCS